MDLPERRLKCRPGAIAETSYISYLPAFSQSRRKRRRAGRRLISALVFCLLLPEITACFSHPGWIHELPGAGASSGLLLEDLKGTWVRRVESRHRLMTRGLFWRAREWIEVGDKAPNSYRKVHLYAEYYEPGQVYRRVAYREEGFININGEWVILEPTISEIYRGSTSVASGKDSPGSSKDVSLPRLDGLVFETKSGVKPLVYYFENEKSVLTPVIFERFGELYEHGLYEGCAEPYQSNTPAFRATLDVYNIKAFHSHGYYRERAKPDEAI